MSIRAVVCIIALSTCSRASAQSAWLADTILRFAGPADRAPQSQQARFRDYLLATGGPTPLASQAAAAAIGQWRTSPPEWGQGWGAYGHRVGAGLAYNATRQTISYGVSTALREDTRYFGCPDDGALRRSGYAVLSTVTALGPSGKRRFSIASTAGVLGTALISSVWGPSTWKGAGNIAGNAGVSFGSTAAFNVVREFLPDLLRRPRK